MAEKTRIIYILHFDIPYRHAYHYVGSTTNLFRRLREHGNGTSTGLLKAFHDIGSKIVGVTILYQRYNKTGYDLEYHIKQRIRKVKSLCGICSATIKATRGKGGI